MLYFISLLGVFLENSVFVSAEKLYFVSIPFFSYLLFKKEGNTSIPLLLVILFVALQGDRYFYFLLYFSLYAILCYFLFRYMEYNRGTIVYLTILEIVFYATLRHQEWNPTFFVAHIVVFFLLNYFYFKGTYKE